MSGERGDPPGRRRGTRALAGSGRLLAGLSALGLGFLAWTVFDEFPAHLVQEPEPSDAPVAVIVSPVRFELSPGDSIHLRVEGVDASAELVHRVRPTWTVRPRGRASVDSTGLVIAHTEGEILVTATVGHRSSTASGTIGP